MGAWCSPVSRVRSPDYEVPLLKVDDDWVTAWLVKKWGVSLGVLDYLYMNSDISVGSRQQSSPTHVMAAHLLIEAANAGFTLPMREGVRISDPDSVTPTSLFSCVRAPKEWNTHDTRGNNPSKPCTPRN